MEILSFGRDGDAAVGYCFCNEGVPSAQDLLIIIHIFAQTIESVEILLQVILHNFFQKHKALLQSLILLPELSHGLPDELVLALEFLRAQW